MKTLRTVLKWIAIGMVAVLTTLLMLNAIFVSSSGTQLEQHLAALRQAGDPVQIADLAREPVPAETNADVFLRRAADDLDAIQKELMAEYPNAGYPTGAVSVAEQGKLDQLFGSYPRVMPLLEQAANCPNFDSQIDVTLAPTRFLEPYMDRSSKHRLVSRVLSARSAWLITKGRGDDALATQILPVAPDASLAPRAIDHRISDKRCVPAGRVW